MPRKAKSSTEVQVQTSKEAVEPIYTDDKFEIKNTSIESLISQAIQNKVSVETVEKLLAMRRELKQEFAKEQFDKALAKFQGECPVIEKSKAGGKTYSGEVAYYYAPLESIVSQVRHLIQENGFSYSVQTQTLGDKVKVTCIIKHQAGHSESSDIEVPLSSGTKVMSAPQVVASALTFAKRYAFCNAFGILTGDEDNDAQLSNTNNKVKMQPVAVSSPTEAFIDQTVPEELPTIDLEPEKPKVSDKTKIAYLVKVLKITEPITDKIKAITGVEFIEQNYSEIVGKLEEVYKQVTENK